MIHLLNYQAFRHSTIFIFRQIHIANYAVRGICSLKYVYAYLYNSITVDRIIRILGGSLFVEFVDTPHPQIYIRNETTKFLLNTFMEKRMVCNTPFTINKQACT